MKLAIRCSVSIFCLRMNFYGISSSLCIIKSAKKNLIFNRTLNCCTARSNYRFGNQWKGGGMYEQEEFTKVCVESFAR